ncbi:MAG: hypothetical protein QOJ63_1280 [Solirubrobacteraceae bacterium]|nr:hypothetical protein [Solirubrobacteraceae bacterium]
MSNKIKVIVGVVVVAVLAIVAVVLLTGGSDDQQASRKGSSSARGAKSSGGTGGAAAGGGASSGPSLRTFASDAATGPVVSVQADGRVMRPRELWLRVSAAPKQPVAVAWSLTCGSGANGLDNYTVTPPDLRQLKVPKKNARVCAVSVSARLSGKGRLKVALLRDR